MLLRRLPRLALHWLVIITLVASTVVLPAQAADEALQQAAAAQMAAAMEDMPCGDEMPASGAHKMPCDCCTPASCDLSACLGTAYLHTLPYVVAAVPLHLMHVAGNTPARPSRSPDTLLRPPIA